MPSSDSHNRPPRPRSPLAGPSTPSPPFPISLSGPVIKGFGRGSRELGIPTANIPLAGLSVGGHSELESGVYFGWAGLNVDDQGNSSSSDDGGEGKQKSSSSVWPMVMSIGWNPFYKNTVRSVVRLPLALLSSFLSPHPMPLPPPPFTFLYLSHSVPRPKSPSLAPVPCALRACGETVTVEPLHGRWGPGGASQPAGTLVLIFFFLQNCRKSTSSMRSQEISTARA